MTQLILTAHKKCIIVQSCCWITILFGVLLYTPEQLFRMCVSYQKYAVYPSPAGWIICLINILFKTVYLDNKNSIFFHVWKSKHFYLFLKVSDFIAWLDVTKDSELNIAVKHMKTAMLTIIIMLSTLFFMSFAYENNKIIQSRNSDENIHYTNIPVKVTPSNNVCTCTCKCILDKIFKPLCPIPTLSPTFGAVQSSRSPAGTA